MNETVIDLINKREFEKEQELREVQVLESIQNGSLKMNGQTIAFEERKLLGDKISLWLPKDFAIMSPENISMKYPSERRPGLIYTNEAGNINITLNHTQTVLEDVDVQRFRDFMIETIEKMQPAVSWLESGMKNIDGKNSGYFDFISPSLDSYIYNFMLVTELHGRALIISFNCPQAELDDWRPVAMGVMATLEIDLSGERKEIEKKVSKDFSGCWIKSGSYGIYHGKEFLLFKMGDNEYRLISTDTADQEDGFKPKDGVFKKTVVKSEIVAAYRVKPIIIYQGHEFELRQELKDQVQLVKKSTDFNFANKLEMQRGSPGEFVKWINKSEIEDILEERFQIEDFQMPELS